MRFGLDLRERKGSAGLQKGDVLCRTEAAGERLGWGMTIMDHRGKFRLEPQEGFGHGRSSKEILELEAKEGPSNPQRRAEQNTHHRESSIRRHCHVGLVCTVWLEGRRLPVFLLLWHIQTTLLHGRNTYILLG